MSEKDDKTEGPPKHYRLHAEGGHYDYTTFPASIVITPAAERLIEAAQTSSEKATIVKMSTILWQQEDPVLTALAANPTPALIDELGVSGGQPDHIKALAEMVITNKEKSRDKDSHLFEKAFDWGMKIGVGVVLTLVAVFAKSLFS